MNDTLTAAETALAKSLDDSIGRRGSTRELPDAVGVDVDRYCKAARGVGLPAEQALIRLKAMIARAYSRSNVLAGRTGADILWVAVQRCVKAFYGTASPHNP